MTEIERINRALYRRISPGDQFSNYITEYLGVKHKFEKPTQYSDTYDTLEFMAKWSEKYNYQVKHLAPLLKGSTLKETVANIYRFLYQHFQYSLDGELQHLYSPSAAWHYRNKGFDCKTFSLLASCILTNLSIDHAFRMVKQPDQEFYQLGIMPEFSHVYVVVPDGNNKYYVIDATRHQNTEVGFIEKHDRPMKNLKHIGLAAPFTGLSCACDGKPLAAHGLGNPTVRNSAIANLHRFLDVLESQGVSPQVTTAIINEVRANVQNGNDPNFSQAVRQALQKVYRPNGLGADLAAMATTGSAAAAGDPMAIMSIVSSIIPTNFISSTFGAVFANGFTLDCWGASLTPQDAESNMKKYHGPYFTYILNQIRAARTNADSQAWINMFLKDTYALYVYYTIYKPKDANWSDCAKKAIGLYVKYMTKMKLAADTMVSDLVAKGALQSTAKMQPLKFTFPKAMTGASNDKVEMQGGRPESFVDYPVLDISRVVLPSATTPATGTSIDPVSQNVVQSNPDGTTTVLEPNGTQTVFNSDGSVKEVIRPTGKGDTKEPMTMTTKVVIGAGLATAALLMIMPSTTTPRTKGLNAPKSRRTAKASARTKRKTNR